MITYLNYDKIVLGGYIMYCRNCGKEIDENAFICVHCGSLVNGVSVFLDRHVEYVVALAAVLHDAVIIIEGIAVG